MPDYISSRHRTNHYRRDPEFQYLEDELNGHHRRRRTSEQRHHHNDGYGGRRSSNTALSGLHSSRRQQHHRGLAQHAQHASSYYGTHAFDDVSSSHRSRRSGTSPSDHQQSHRRRRSNEPEGECWYHNEATHNGRPVGHRTQDCPSFARPSSRTPHTPQRDRNHGIENWLGNVRLGSPQGSRYSGWSNAGTDSFYDSLLGYYTNR